MNASDRTGFVRFQQRLARMALEHGELGAARGALRVLRVNDFSGVAARIEEFFAVLRDPRSSQRELRDAIIAVIELGPADLAG